MTKSDTAELRESDADRQGAKSDNLEVLINLNKKLSKNEEWSED